MGDFLDTIASVGKGGTGSTPVASVPNSPSTHWSSSVGTIMNGLANLGTVGLGYVNAFKGNTTPTGIEGMEGSEGVDDYNPNQSSGLSTNKILLIGVALVAVLFFVLKGK